MQQPSQQPGFTAHGPEYHQRDLEQGSAGNPGIELTAGGAACPGAMEGCRNGIYRFSRKGDRSLPRTVPQASPSLDMQLLLPSRSSCQRQGQRAWNLPRLAPMPLAWPAGSPGAQRAAGSPKKCPSRFRAALPALRTTGGVAQAEVSSAGIALRTSPHYCDPHNSA